MRVPGHRVLVKPVDVAETTKTDWGFEVVVPENEREYKANTSEGTVVGIGPTAWMAYDYWTPTGERNPHWEPWCEVGDKIYYSKYAVKWIEINGEEFVVLNDQDVIIGASEDE